MAYSKVDGDGRSKLAQMWEAGWSQGQLAVKFGVTQQAIGRILHKWYGDRYDEAAIVHEASRSGTTGASMRMSQPTTADVVWDMFRQGWACSSIDAVLRLARGTSHGMVVGKWADDKERYERSKAAVR